MNKTKDSPSWSSGLNIPLFYKPKPVFGFDIGHGTIKISQVSREQSSALMLGYGFTTFDQTTIKDGVLTDLEAVAKAAYSLLTSEMIGSVDTNRVAISLPVAHTFTKILELPDISGEELDAAVQLEAEQYIPVPLEDLYIDYEITNPIIHTETEAEQKQEVLMVAVKRAIVDSYLELFNILGLEVELLEPTTSAIVRAVQYTYNTTKPVLIIDFGSESSDLTVYEKTIRVTDTISVGGNQITQALSKSLKITERQAHSLKARYGLNPHSRQMDVIKALEPVLNKLSAEIKKILRYYKDRNQGREEVSEIVILGGGANLPGLDKHLEKATSLKVVTHDAWANIDFGSLQKPHPLEATLYTTATGSALYVPKGVK